MKATVRKWGNSLALRIPRSLADDADVKEGSRVEMHLEGNRLVIVAAQEYDLKKLLGDVTQENIHTEIETGRSVGNEMW